MRKKSLLKPAQFFTGYVCHTVSDNYSFTVGPAAAFLSHLTRFGKGRVNCSFKALDKVSKACNRAFKLCRKFATS